MREKLARLFTEKRTERGLSQRCVAQAIGVSTDTIQSIETGRRNPSLDVIEKLCTFFDLVIDIHDIK